MARSGALRCQTEIQARDIFDIAAAARSHREEIVHALRNYPDRVRAAEARLHKLNPDFVTRTISQLMIKPGYEDLVPTSFAIVGKLMTEV